MVLESHFLPCLTELIKKKQWDRLREALFHLILFKIVRFKCRSILINTKKDHAIALFINYHPSAFFIISISMEVIVGFKVQNLLALYWLNKPLYYYFKNSSQCNQYCAVLLQSTNQVVCIDYYNIGIVVFIKLNGNRKLNNAEKFLKISRIRTVTLSVFHNCMKIIRYILSFIG